MKSMVVYSSRTGNTRKVAQALYDALPGPKELYPVDEAPSPEAYDLVALGFWVDKGTADQKSRRYLEGLKGRKLCLFGTLGAYPDSDHAGKCLARVKVLAYGNDILGTFLCQGRVDPAMIRWMEENLHDDPLHAMTPERRARLREAETHPDAGDLAGARLMVENMLEIIKGDMHEAN